MTDTKHTPGPWYEAGDNLRGNGILAANSHGEYIAIIPDNPNLPQGHNGRLIAEAPNMFLELRETLIDLEEWDGTDEAMQAIKNNLRAAIAKATGQ